MRTEQNNCYWDLASYRCRFSHIQLWFVVNREAYGEDLRLFFIVTGEMGIYLI